MLISKSAGCKEPNVYAVSKKVLYDRLFFYVSLHGSIKRGSGECSDLRLASESKTEFQCSLSQRYILRALVNVFQQHQIKTQFGYKTQVNGQSYGPVKLPSYTGKAQSSGGVCWTADEDASTKTE